jgi:hypothetical protein
VVDRAQRAAERRRQVRRTLASCYPTPDLRALSRYLSGGLGTGPTTPGVQNGPISSTLGVAAGEQAIGEPVLAS